MIYKILQYSAFLAVCILPASCNFLKSEHYPGEPINIEDKDIHKEMVWKLNKDKIFHTVILDKNLIKVGNLEWNEEQEIFYAANQNIILSKLGDNCFINIEDSDGTYKILKFTISSDSTVVAYTVNKEKMEDFIDEGKLKAEIVNDNVVLDLTKIELDDFIDKYSGEIFNYDHPFVFQKIYEKTLKEKQQ